ncbi:MAG: molybdopterin-guanine dinucleotide biosynthesis protein B [Candidatus Thorarchaeota archaeon]|nr:molybdopterin-guanine dinucleotide biosynthesis protein B [Candidatus Thorarchaeota archaeon]
MRVFAVSGYSGTGKTTLVESIVTRLSDEGFTIATAKSSKHDYEDQEGTDSYRHVQAGAKITILLGPNSSVVHHRARKKISALVRRTDADFLIIEGMKESEIPKVWCVGGSKITPEDLNESIKAIISWFEKSVDKDETPPVLKSTDIDGIVKIIKRDAINLQQLSI